MLLAEANLSQAERSAVDRFVALTCQALGDELLAIWLYGSRARGMGGGRDSDVDLMVITAGRLERESVVSDLAVEAALAEPESVYLAAQVWSREHLEGRRAIESFFAQELDRDKIVLHGPGL